MKKNVLFIMVDCLRADKCYGTNRTAKTSNIDSLIKHGTFFSKTVVASPCTIHSIPSIFTGFYRTKHGMRDMAKYKLAVDVTTLAQVFKENGYSTYAEVTGPLLPLTGLDRGFDVYSYRDRYEYFVQEWGDSLINKFKNKEFKEPWFIFLHLWELHEPRCIANGFNHNNFGRNKYERALSGLDAKLGELFKYIDFNTTTIILNGDHGEKISEIIFYDTLYEIKKFINKISLLPTKLLAGVIRKTFKLLRLEYDRLPNFAKHSRFQKKKKPVLNKDIGHGFNLYDYALVTPLIVTGNKEIFPENKFIAQQVRQIDIFPTLVEAFTNKSSAVHGKSLMPLIKGEDFEELPAYCHALMCSKSHETIGLRTTKYKFICRPNNNNKREELYDLENDPFEKKNIVKLYPQVVNSLREKLFKIRDELHKTKMEDQKMTKKEEEVLTDRLRSLGYLD